MKTNLWRRFLFLIILYLTLARPASAQTGDQTFFSGVNHTVHFSENDLIFDEENGYDLVKLKDGVRIGEIGKPDLPLKLVHLLIPNDTEVASLVITSDSYKVGEYLVFPAQPDEKTDGMIQHGWVYPDSLTYNSESFYPGKLGEIMESGYLAGNHIVTLALYPLQYRPKSRKLFLHTDLDLELKLRSSADISSSTLIKRKSYQASKIFAAILNEMVDNKSVLLCHGQQGSNSSLSKISDEGSEEHPYIIITSSQLKSAFLPLLEWKIKKGIKTTLVTVDSILNTYPGRDDPEKVRNFLTDAYQNGTIWVLLGGDEDVVPTRYTYHANASTPPSITNQQICDLYYSDVDGEWELDNDGIWGEPQDDDPDIYPDLFVGRVPCSDSSEAASFVEKLLLYEKNPGNGSTDYLASALWICSDQMRDWSEGMGQHVLASQYADSNFYQDLSTLIETPSGSSANPISPNGQDCIQTMDQGWGIISVLAHGIADGFVAKSNQINGVPRSWVYTAPGENDGHGHLPSLSNQGKYGIMYSIACKQSAIDVDKYPQIGSEPCVGELYPLSPNNGGVAFLGYTRWGWVGTSYKLLEKFLQYLFADSLQHHLGIAEALSRCSYPSYRDLNYGHNLFGDPEMPVWTEVPHALTATHPSKVTMGLRTINISVFSEDVGVPDATVCLSLNQRIMFVGTTDQDGLLSAQVNLDDVGEMSVVVTKPNFLPYEGNITISITADVEEDEK
ncbi:MAG: C25 family cysteine peptidase, partial [Candidatus Zixiibacteriota bacterium]